MAPAAKEHQLYPARHNRGNLNGREVACYSRLACFLYAECLLGLQGLTGFTIAVFPYLALQTNKTRQNGVFITRLRIVNGIHDAL